MSNMIEDPTGKRTAKCLVLAVLMSFVAGAVGDYETWWSRGLEVSCIVAAIILIIASIATFPSDDTCDKRHKPPPPPNTR